VTIEILAKRRAERRVRRHGTTGARSTRSYRVSKSAPRDAKLTEPLTDTVSTAKDFRKRRRAMVRPDQGVRGRTAPARSSRNSRNFTEVLTTIGTSGDGRSRPYRAVVPRWQVGYTSTRHGTSGVTRPRSYRAVVPCPRPLHRQQEARF
jgi:hypothetical protein